MDTKSIVLDWFKNWESGDFKNIPVSNDFKHTSPFGTIEGKEAYLKIVEENKSQFLGHKFEIHDGLYEKHKACVRYCSIKGHVKLEVTEWYYFKNDLIHEIFSYYHIGEIREDSKLK